MALTAFAMAGTKSDCICYIKAFTQAAGDDQKSI